MNRSNFCAVAGITPKIFENWIALGIPVVSRPKDKGGEWIISPSQVFQWLFAKASSAPAPTSGSDLNLESERARLAKEQADGHELKNAALRAELLPESEVVAGWQAATGRARSLLIGIATSAPMTLLMLAQGHEPQDAERLIREDLTCRIDAALAELQNTSLDAEDDGEAQPADDSGAS